MVLKKLSKVPKIKYGYKIVVALCKKDKTRKYLSVYVKGKAQVEYFFDQFVEPPKWLKERGFWLTCFSNKKFVETYLEKCVPCFSSQPVNNQDTFLEYQLMRIEYEPASGDLPPFCSERGLRKGFIYELDQMNYPEGTKFATKIKLIEHLKTKEW